MNQNYTFNYFTPSESTLENIRQFARTFRPMMVEGRYIPFDRN